jgi:hypothetical protein
MKMNIGTEILFDLPGDTAGSGYRSAMVSSIVGDENL